MKKKKKKNEEEEEKGGRERGKTKQTTNTKQVGLRINKVSRYANAIMKIGLLVNRFNWSYIRMVRHFIVTTFGQTKHTRRS